MSKEDYTHWGEKRDSWFKTMKLAESEIAEIHKTYFKEFIITGSISKEQFEEYQKEISAVYNKYEILVKREGEIVNKNKK